MIYFIAVLMLSTIALSNEIETEETKFENKGTQIIHNFLI